MKIKVGNTYRNQDGREVYIEAKLTHMAPASHPYLGSYPPSRGYDFFNENGELLVGTARAHGGDLLPNTVKKEGWAVLYRYGPKGDPYSGRVHSSKEEAELEAEHLWSIVKVLTVTKVEWEEEE